MKFRPFILRCAAVLMIAVFSQKAGTGLFLHNLFHQNPSSELPAKGDSEISYACSCIDDFLAPFTAVETTDYFPATIFHTTPAVVYPHTIPFRAVAHTSLRGPPAHTA